MYTIRYYGRHHRRVIFLLGGWGSFQALYWPISKILQFSGFYCITYAFSYRMLTPDLDETIRNVTRVKQQILETINTLTAKGYEDFSIFGTSLGALIGLLVANEAPEIKKVIFNTPGLDMAESIWKWDKVVPGFKQELINRYATLAVVKKVIRPLEPKNNLDNLKNKELLIYVAAQDEMVASRPRILKKVLTQKKCHYNIVINPTHGHVVTGVLNLINAPHYLGFLNR